MRESSTSDGRTSAHITRALPVRIHKVHTPDKIPELHFVWNCNFAGFTPGRSFYPRIHPLPARFPCSVSSVAFLLVEGARRALYQRECVRGRARGASGDIYGVFSLGKQQAAARVTHIFSRKIHSDVVADRGGNGGSSCGASGAPRDDDEYK